jgi:SNF2 family DNA or RNA helicase
LHNGIASQCLAARVEQLEKLPRGDKKRKKAAQQSLLDSRIVNMNYNNLVMQLRKLCNHPYLVLEDVQTIPDSLYFRDLVCSSGKLVVLDQLLDQLLGKEEEHKILIFSQMTTMLNILQGFLHTKGISCYRLDGSTDRHTREEIISKFYNGGDGKTKTSADGGISLQRGEEPSGADEIDLDTSGATVESDVRVFLLSTRAGKSCWSHCMLIAIFIFVTCMFN